jgi:hypothetical protein
MSEQKELRITVAINQESYLCSLVKDATSIGLLGFLCWFNHNFIGGSYFVNFLILCMILLYIPNIAKSGAENCSFYHGVSKEKIKQIKQILKEQENVRN